MSTKDLLVLPAAQPSDTHRAELRQRYGLDLEPSGQGSIRAAYEDYCDGFVVHPRTTKEGVIPFGERAYLYHQTPGSPVWADGTDSNAPAAVPQVVQLGSIENDESGLHLKLEYVEGLDLSAELVKKSFPPHMAQSMVRKFLSEHCDDEHFHSQKVCSLFDNLKQEKLGLSSTVYKKCRDCRTKTWRKLDPKREGDRRCGPVKGGETAMCSWANSLARLGARGKKGSGGESNCREGYYATLAVWVR